MDDESPVPRHRPVCSLAATPHVHMTTLGLCRAASRGFADDLRLASASTRVNRGAKQKAGGRRSISRTPAPVTSILLMHPSNYFLTGPGPAGQASRPRSRTTTAGACVRACVSACVRARSRPRRPSATRSTCDLEPKPFDRALDNPIHAQSQAKPALPVSPIRATWQ